MCTQEYTVSIRNADGEDIGQVKLLVVDLTESDHAGDFWTCWETQTPVRMTFVYFQLAS